MYSDIVWKITDDGLKPFLRGSSGGDRPVVWAPQPGSQQIFLECPTIEVLYEGQRGPGKTDALIMDFCQDVGKGYGAEWRGILFRRTYPELQDVIDKSKKWIPMIWPGAFFNESKNFWEWPTGEKLFFRHFNKPVDYWSYHGHAYPWIGWEELTSWPDDKCFKSMFSCSRSTKVGMPRKIRSTTNPYGVGHNWVKMRYGLPIALGRTLGPLIVGEVDEDGYTEPPRRAIRGVLAENRILLHADPHYPDKIAAAANSPQQRKAWLLGDWDIVAGGMFDDVWLPSLHVVEPFVIPNEWKMSRSFDWGSTKPFSVGWWAESDGSDVHTPSGWVSTVRGDLFRTAEWYGWNGKANEGLKLLNTEIAKGIVERQIAMKIQNRVLAGPAGSDVFSQANNTSIAKDMKQPIRLNGKQYPGVDWIRADNRPGSRVAGWSVLRSRLKDSKRPEKAARELPGLFVFSHCDQFLRTFPVLTRCAKNMDDVDTESEDHIGDEVRYRVTTKRSVGGSSSVVGLS